MSTTLEFLEINHQESILHGNDKIHKLYLSCINKNELGLLVYFLIKSHMPVIRSLGVLMRSLKDSDLSKEELKMINDTVKHPIIYNPTLNINAIKIIGDFIKSKGNIDDSSLPWITFNKLIDL